MFVNQIVLPNRFYCLFCIQYTNLSLGIRVHTFAVSGPGMVSRSFLSNTAWKSVPDRLTPRTWPVVRNKYVTERKVSHIHYKNERHLLPVATAMSARDTQAMIAYNLLFGVQQARCDSRSTSK
jgi:hypothetical protein